VHGKTGKLAMKAPGAGNDARPYPAHWYPPSGLHMQGAGSSVLAYDEGRTCRRRRYSAIASVLAPPMPAASASTAVSSLCDTHGLHQCLNNTVSKASGADQSCL